MFMAIFWAFMMGCLIIGNALGAYVLVYFTASTYYVILTVFCTVGSLFFLILPKPIPQGQKVAKTEENGKSSVVQTWNLMISARMLKVIPVIIYSSMSAGIYASLLVPLLARTMKSTLSN